jgi:hypothetical protein
MPTYSNESYTLELYNGRAGGDRSVYVDLLVCEPGSRYSREIYLASIMGEKKDVEAAAALMQESKTGRIRPSNNVRGENQHRFNVHSHVKKSQYDELDTKIEDLSHTLLVSKTSKPSTKERQEWQVEEDRLIAAGASPRNLPSEFSELVLAWDGDYRTQIYKILNDRYSTPMIEDWKDYIVDRLIEERYYAPLQVCCFGNEYQLEAGLLKINEKRLEAIISEGLESYELDFAIMDDGRAPEEGVLKNCETLDQYLTEFAGELAERIQQNVEIRFDPKRDKHHPAFRDVNLAANEKGITGLFPPQADAVMGIAKTLVEDDYCFGIGEMGVGKTPFGLTIPYITEAMLNKQNSPKPFRTLVFSPAIMVEKWKREIEERIPNVEVYEIKSWHDVMALKNKPYRPEKIEYYVMNSDLPKYTYPMVPIKDWRYSETDLEAQMALYREKMEEAAETLGERPAAPRFRFKLEEMQNEYTGVTNQYLTHSETGFHCPSCGGLLTEKKNPSGVHFFEQRAGGKWATRIKKDTNMVCKNMVKTASLPKEKIKYANRDEQECGFVMWQPEVLPLDSKKRKVSPAWMINKHLRRGFFKYLLADEVHEYKSGDSSIAQAFGQLINHTEKQILLTGTLMGGMASDIFYLLARLDPKRLLKESIRYKDESLFTKRYGIYEIKTTRTSGEERAKKSSNKKPGLSPHLFPIYLMPNCAFLELADLGYALPPYQEIPVMVDMDEEQKQHYNALESQIGGMMRQNAYFGGMRFVSTYINTMYQYADAPFNMEVITAENEEAQEVELGRPYNYDPETFMPEKLRQVTDILDQEIYQHGRKTLIYTKYTGNSSYNAMDTYLYDKLKALGYKVGILKSSGSYDGIKMPTNSKGREQWFKDMMAKHDWDVLITNPKLVKVGLDLLQFPTIMYYQMDYSTYEYMQSSRRSWRIKQTNPVKVYTFVYRDTIQANVLEHIAQKIDAAMAMQGKFSEEGLRAMADSSDGMASLAKNLLKEGKLDNVETIHERFQRLNHSYEEMQNARYEDYDSYEVNPIEGGMETVKKIAAGMIKELEGKIASGVVSPSELVAYMEKFDEMMKIVEDVNVYNKGLKKKDRAVEGQLALDIF